MRESVDLRKLLRDWPYDSDDDARITRGDDERQILQVRTPMGIEQYELDDRPDGERPHGRATALDFYLEKLEAARAADEADAFTLSHDECTELFSEGTLFYFRYVRLFQLKDWARAIRDTNRNLRVFDFIKRHAGREEDRTFLEKWRPYVIRINVSAAAMLELEKQAYDQALRLTQEGIETIEQLEEIDDETFAFERDRSIGALRDLAAQIQKNRPISPLEQLERQLRRAIERQEFERAARLRDRIRALKERQHIC